MVRAVAAPQIQRRHQRRGFHIIGSQAEAELSRSRTLSDLDARERRVNPSGRFRNIRVKNFAMR
jgi:hypothetical protein